jgi:hypothetical protein
MKRCDISVTDRNELAISFAGGAIADYPFY